MGDRSEKPEPGSQTQHDGGESSDARRSPAGPASLPGHSARAFPALEFLYDVLRERRRRLVSPLRADEVADAIVYFVRFGVNHCPAIHKGVDKAVVVWERRQKTGDSGTSA